MRKLILILVCLSLTILGCSGSDKKQMTIINLTKAIRINPNNAIAYNNRGEVYLDQGKYDEAISDFTRAIEIDSKYSRAFNCRGIAYQRKGNLDYALIDYTKAIDIDPNYVKAYCNRGSVYNEKGNDEKGNYEKSNNESHIFRNQKEDKKINFNYAISDYTKAIDIDPKYVKAYCNRGDNYRNKGDYEQAISDYNKALEIDPNFYSAYLGRGGVYCKQFNWSQAVSDFSKAIEINSKLATVYFCRAIVYNQQGNFTQAISDYTKTIAIDPNYAEAYNNRGIIYYNMKEYDKAKKDWYKAEKLGFQLDPTIQVMLKGDPLRLAIERVLGPGNRNIPRVSSINFDDSEKGAILVNWALRDNLTLNLVKSGAKSDVVDILKAIHKSGIDYTYVLLRGSCKMDNKFGNSSEEDVVNLTFYKETVEKINWDNFLTDNIYTIADKVSNYPQFQD